MASPVERRIPLDPVNRRVSLISFAVLSVGPFAAPAAAVSVAPRPQWPTANRTDLNPVVPVCGPTSQAGLPRSRARRQPAA